MSNQSLEPEDRRRLEKLSTSNLSDALDALGLRGAVIGIRPLFGMPKVIGPAVTIKLTAAGITKPKRHLGVDAISGAAPGDVIAIDNRGDLHNNCWGDIAACAAKQKGISGVIIDGASRDVDACQEMDFPVFARGVVPITARGRIVQEDFNCLIRLGDVQVRPGDILVADANGVVVIPRENLADVMLSAEAIFAKEEAIKADLLAGMDYVAVDRKYNYERMLKE